MEIPKLGQCMVRPTVRDSVAPSTVCANVSRFWLEIVLRAMTMISINLRHNVHPALEELRQVAATRTERRLHVQMDTASRLNAHIGLLARSECVMNSQLPGVNWQSNLSEVLHNEFSQDRNAPMSQLRNCRSSAIMTKPYPDDSTA